MAHHFSADGGEHEPRPGELHGSRHTWIVDVVQDGSAAVSVDGRQVTPLPRWLLPLGAKEGDVLTVIHERHGDTSHLIIEIDPAATREAYDGSP